jgi:hypothetical protein
VERYIYRKSSTRLERALERALEREREQHRDLLSAEALKFEKALGEERRKCAASVLEVEKQLQTERASKEEDVRAIKTKLLSQSQEKHQAEMEKHRRELQQTQNTCQQKLQELQEVELPAAKRKFEEDLRAKLTGEFEERRKALEEQASTKLRLQLEELTTKFGKESLGMERECQQKLESEKKKLWENLTAEHKTLERRLLEAQEEKTKTDQKHLELITTHLEVKTQLEVYSAEICALKTKVYNLLAFLSIAHAYIYAGCIVLVSCISHVCLSVFRLRSVTSASSRFPLKSKRPTNCGSDARTICRNALTRRTAVLKPAWKRPDEKRPTWRISMIRRFATWRKKQFKKRTSCSNG